MHWINCYQVMQRWSHQYQSHGEKKSLPLLIPHTYTWDRGALKRNNHQRGNRIPRNFWLETSDAQLTTTTVKSDQKLALYFIQHWLVYCTVDTLQYTYIHACLQFYPHLHQCAFTLIFLPIRPIACFTTPLPSELEAEGSNASAFIAAPWLSAPSSVVEGDSLDSPVAKTLKYSMWIQSG